MRKYLLPLSLPPHTHTRTHTHTYTHTQSHNLNCVHYICTTLVVASSRPFLSSLHLYISKAQYALLFPTPTPLLPHFYPIPHSSEDPFVSPRDVLFNWRDQNKQCLALTDVHIETSGGIRVTVMPFYMGCRVRGGEGRDRGRCGGRGW